MKAALCFAVMALASLFGLALGGSACLALYLSLQEPEAWICLGAGALTASAIASVVVNRILIAPQHPARPSAGPEQPAAAPPTENQRRLRHDIRGALSPAMLMADRLLTHRDPAVQRAGDIVVRAVERASALLMDQKPVAGPPAEAPETASAINRPGHP